MVRNALKKGATLVRRERAIEDAILAQPERVGFPSASAIRNCRIGLPAGLVDVLLLPKAGPAKLVLVETKVASATDSASKVIGQLLMYYAGALTFGSVGLEKLRAFATDEPTRTIARGYKRISPKALTGISPPALAWKTLGAGQKLQPKQIRLFVALDGRPHPALKPTLRALADHHKLKIGLLLVENGKVRLLPLEDDG